MNEKDPKNQLIDKIKKVTNILVTVSSSPSVDQLTAALALTIILDKIKKHATAVFSGQIPPVMNFLEPEKTFESSGDSLRDFIISLDKSKADRLRMKTDGDFVKILVTPYRAKITPEDINFSEGDFNVELVIAIGVKDKNDLDLVLRTHGRIFHDATIATLNLDAAPDNLGSITWQSPSGSSYSELVTELADEINGEESLLDEQISTALLTGVVATTDQFRNEKTTPAIMKLSAELMAHGANQQLIVSELAAAQEEGAAETVIDNSPESSAGANAESENADSGVLEINQDSPATENPATDNSIAELESKAQAEIAKLEQLTSPVPDNADSIAEIDQGNSAAQNETSVNVNDDLQKLDINPPAETPPAESPEPELPTVQMHSRPQIPSPTGQSRESLLPAVPPPDAVADASSISMTAPTGVYIEPPTPPNVEDIMLQSGREPAAGNADKLFPVVDLPAAAPIPSAEDHSAPTLPPAPNLSSDTSLPPPPPLPMPDFDALPPEPETPPAPTEPNSEPATMINSAIRTSDGSTIGVPVSSPTPPSTPPANNSDSDDAAQFKIPS